MFCALYSHYSSRALRRRLVRSNLSSRFGWVCDPDLSRFLPIMASQVNLILSRKLLHFEQRLDEGQRRFCALVFVQAIDVQSIPAAARHLIVDRYAQGIASEEPLKCMSRQMIPFKGFRRSIS